MNWSYIAGYFDGEGNVNFSMTARGDSTRGLHWFNTHVESLRAMRDFMGVGRVVERSNHSGFGGKKPAYVLSVTNKAGMLHVLDNILPHLIIKRAQAEALRAYLIEHVDETRSERFGTVAAVNTETLRRWYWDERLSFAQIAERLGGVSPSAVSQAFKLRGLNTRPPSEQLKGIPKSAETRARMILAQRQRTRRAFV